MNIFIYVNMFKFNIGKNTKINEVQHCYNINDYQKLHCTHNKHKQYLHIEKFLYNIYYNNNNKIIIITSQVKIIMIIIIKVIICCVKISQEFKEKPESNSRNFIIVFLCLLWNYASQVCLSATILWWDKIPNFLFRSLFVYLVRCAFKSIH